MTVAQALGVAIALVALWVVALICWELGHRQGHKHERDYAKARWAKVLSILQLIEPEAYEAVEVATFVLEQGDWETAQLEKMFRR